MQAEFPRMLFAFINKNKVGNHSRDASAFKDLNIFKTFAN